MRWVRFTADGRTAYGSVSNETITEVEGEPWGATSPTGRTYPLSAVKLEIPVVPRTFYAAGINYAAHIREMAEKRGVQPVFPEKADIGYRAMCSRKKPTVLCGETNHAMASISRIVPRKVLVSMMGGARMSN